MNFSKAELDAVERVAKRYARNTVHCLDYGDIKADLLLWLCENFNAVSRWREEEGGEGKLYTSLLRQTYAQEKEEMKRTFRLASPENSPSSKEIRDYFRENFGEVESVEHSIIYSSYLDLTKKQQATIMAVYVEGRSKEEAANLLGISPRSIDVTAHRAIKTIRQKMVGTTHSHGNTVDGKNMVFASLYY